MRSETRSARRVTATAAAGMREGELVALTWGDVNLVEAVVAVRRSFTESELTSPKNRRSRKVDVSADVVELLGAW